MTRFLTDLALVAVLAALLIFALNSWASLPVVYKSVETNRCVRVDDPSGQYGCGNLPPRYDHQWVR